MLFRSAGEKTVVLKRDEDYRLKLEENADASYEEIIPCYELPEAITLTGKVFANTNESVDSNPPKQEKPNTNETQNEVNSEKTNKKTNQKKAPSKLVYTGGTIGSGAVIVASSVFVFHFVTDRNLRGKKKSRMERILK